MIVVHGETLWSPAPQPMDDDDDDGGKNRGIKTIRLQNIYACTGLLVFREGPHSG